MGVLDEYHANVDAMVRQIGKLTEIVDELETVVHGGLLRVYDGQDAARWTNIPVCVAFSDQYKRTIDLLDQTVGVIWAEVKKAVDGLQSAAVDVGIVEGDVADALNALAERVGENTVTFVLEPVDGTGATGETGDVNQIGQGVN